MNTEEDEFNRIEREASMRMAAVTATVAKRQWVGLTDEEITDIWAEASPYYHEDDFARAIEAKLKEKNDK
jgi:hypothetical protein